MKKIIRFIPLAIGFGALFLYIYSRFTFKYIGNTAMMASILYNMRIYLYITIIAFLAYAFIYLFEFLTRDKNKIKDSKEDIIEESYNIEDVVIDEKLEDKIEDQVDMVLERKYKYCNRCNSLIDIDSKYCKTCGKEQIKNKFISIIKKIINFIEILILFILVVISVLLVFDYKEKTDPKFESPIKFNLTK